MAVAFDDIEFVPGTIELFIDMATAAFAQGERRTFLYTNSLGGRRELRNGRWNRLGVDHAALDDLAGWGFVRLSYGGARGSAEAWTITSEGYRYYQWLREQQGAAVSQVEATVRQSMNGEAFARSYPLTAAQLNRATALLWTGDASTATSTDLGVALRSAVQDFVSELLASSKIIDAISPEKPFDRLRAALPKLTASLGQREPDVIAAYVVLAEKSWRHVQRLAHVREEGPVSDWNELRRSVFAIVFVLHEFSTLAQP